MIFANVDAICRRSLLERGLPIHYYLENLVHITAGVRELSFDTLQIVNTLELPVNDYNAVDLPDDFSDDVALCYGGAGFLRQLHHAENINPLRFHDDTGAYVKPPYPKFDVNGQGFYGLRGLGWYWNINEYGEPTGRFYGARGASDRDGYKVVRERRQIQLSNDAPCDTVILMYISDGQRADNATQLDSSAQACLQSYRDWKSSPNAAMKDSAEARTFYNEKRLLRARKSELTGKDVAWIVKRSYTASMKN